MPKPVECPLGQSDHIPFACWGQAHREHGGEEEVFFQPLSGFPVTLSNGGKEGGVISFPGLVIL